VERNKFKVNQRVIFVRPDTIVDNTKPYFSTMKKNRILTRKILDIFSQGLIRSMEDILVHENVTIAEIESMSMSGTLSMLLGVTKYHKELDYKSFDASKAVGFPVHLIHRTDEIEKDLTAAMNGIEFYCSLKMDGSSMTLIWHEGWFYGCSRNLCFYKKHKNNEDATIESPCTMLQFIKEYGYDVMNISNCCVQGEFCGPKINKNKLKLNKFMFYIFNVKNLEEGYYGLKLMIDFCNVNKFDVVPILFIDKMTVDWTFQKFRNIANDVKYGDDKGEGIVVRTCTVDISRLMKTPMGFKVINQNYKD
jgi:predicted amino acid-binding ACT domain protein